MRRNREHGTVIALVAVFMLFVVGAMAALSIDVVTLYTARSEAQLVADAAALAAARVLANSGATSDTTGTLMPQAQPIAQNVAMQVAQNSMVGGRYLVAGEIVVGAVTGTTTNPRITVRVQRTDLPTFFARIWGNTQLAVAASATAEAYNPSGGPGISAGSAPPVAPLCVKPWLLPNIDPTSVSSAATTIFNPSGAITNPALLGWSSVSATPKPMTLACNNGDCSGTGIQPAAAWGYYPGDPNTTFPPPGSSLPTCSQVPTLTPYQASVAGCIQTPISCNNPNANVDTSVDGMRISETANAVNCLTHDTTAGEGDTVTSTVPASAPFQFVAGNGNPIAGAGTDVMVSDSLVTVPVFDTLSFNAGGTNFQIIGFVQLFLNPDSNPADPASSTGSVNTTIINLAGCGTTATGQPIIGNGASPVAVRLISGP